MKTTKAMKSMKEYLAADDYPFDITFYQNYLKALYGDINESREFDDLYGNLHRSIGDLGKSIELGILDQSRFIFTISWLIAIANSEELDFNILQALVHKFPGICPYCLKQKCICYRTNKKPENPMSVEEIKNEIFFKWETVSKSIKKYDFDKTVAFISGIYECNEIIWLKVGYHSHMLKIHQEMTEVNEAYNYYKAGKKPKDALKDEVADVFAWILSAWSIRFPNESLDKAFRNHYKEDCPVCGNYPCDCRIRDNPPATLPDFLEVINVKQNLEKINKSLPEHSEVVIKLIDNYIEIIESQDIPLLNAILINTKSYLDEMQLTVTTIDLKDEDLALFSSTVTIVNKLLKEQGNKNHEKSYHEVFLSYAKEDIEEAREIFRFLGGNKVNVFMSEKSIIPGDKWDQVIKNAIWKSKLLCIIISKASLKSEWVKTEADAAWILEKPIVPILLDCSFDELPEKLKGVQAIRFHEFEKVLETYNKLEN